jgi:hypothetical protein
MTRISIDTKGERFRIVDDEGDEAFTEEMWLFLKQAIHMARTLLSSEGGGTFSITVPPHSTRAEADLELNRAKETKTVEGFRGEESAFGDAPHIETSGNGVSAVASLTETFIPAGITGL